MGKEDADYLKLLSEALTEWDSQEDEEAYQDLQEKVSHHLPNS